MTAAEQIAAHPGRYTMDERAQAFTWAYRKQNDRSVSQSFRDRAKKVRVTLWNYAGRTTQIGA
jgi:hypothetical protein